jgi:SAM-dependent methyltransferase
VFDSFVFPLVNDLALGARFEAIRAHVAGGAKGRVLEIGAGTGLNFAHYGPEAEVVALEPSPGSRRYAERRGRVRPGLRMIEGRARVLPFDAGSFDAVVITFTLCSIRDQGVQPALAEVARVLRPGGEVRVAEHVVSPRAASARLQRRVDPVWRIAFGGCSLLRDPRAELARAGFDVSGVEDVSLPLPRPVRWGQVGVARRA